MDKQMAKKAPSREQVAEALEEKGVFAGANIAGMDLSGFDFVAAAGKAPTLAGLNLADGDLSESRLAGAVIAGANLSGVRLDDADLAEATIAGVNLRGASLRRANLRGARLINANLGDADFRDADLRDTRWLATNVAKSDFGGARSEGARATAVPWKAASVPPDPLPSPLIQLPAWALPAVLGTLVVLVVLFWRRRAQDSR